MLTRIGTAFGFAFADDISLFAAAGADTAGIVTIAKMRQLNATHRNADQVLSLLADQLPFGEKFPQIVTDAPLDDLSKSLVIFFDLQDHTN
jgi:hypothetical protein